MVEAEWVLNSFFYLLSFQVSVDKLSTLNTEYLKITGYKKDVDEEMKKWRKLLIPLHQKKQLVKVGLWSARLRRD